MNALVLTGVLVRQLLAGQSGVIAVLVFIWLLLINLGAYALFGFDKQRARTQGRRMAEKTFFLLACLGAVPGLWFGMRAFRHKTKHKRFVFGLPLIALLQVLLIYYLASR